MKAAFFFFLSFHCVDLEASTNLPRPKTKNQINQNQQAKPYESMMLEHADNNPRRGQTEHPSKSKDNEQKT